MIGKTIGQRRSKLVSVMMGCALLAAPSLAQAHFQEIIPAQPLITQQTGSVEHLEMTFTHPMEGGPLMDMGPPQQIGVMVNGKIQDLTGQAQQTVRDGKHTYTLDYQVSAPGDHLFFIEPAPYWEPAEGKMIVHYAKVVVNAFGEEDGWSAPIGLPVEIEPLTRPYGGWTGSVFQGRVLAQGHPVPFAEVEIEYRGQGLMAIPADPFVTQVVRADPNGVFTVALPRGGWWGMAALVDGPQPMKSPAGDSVPVELGGLLWVNVHDLVPAAR